MPPERTAKMPTPVPVGVVLIIGGVLCNQWLMALFSPDGEISSLSHRAIVWFVQFVSIATGVALVRFRPHWPLVWRLLSLARVPLLILWTVVLTETGVRVTNRFFYALELPEHLKDTYRNKWLEGWDFFNGETRLYVFEPNSEGTTYGHPFRANRWGFRGPDFLSRDLVEEDTYRIMVLGDSTTMGEGVAEHERYSDVLAEQLRRAYPTRKLEVINLGVQGLETVQEEKILRRFWSVIQPDLVILGFSSNDPNLRYEYMRTPAPNVVHNWLRGWLTFRLLEKNLYDPIYRRVHQRPTYADHIQAAYARDSRDWRLFQQSVASIGTFVRERIDRAPIVIGLDDVENLKQQGFYGQIVETFEASGFVWVEIPAGLYRWISRFDAHPDKTTHEHFANALLDKIKQLRVIETSDAARP